jgi:hypothetical protein
MQLTLQQPAPFATAGPSTEYRIAWRLPAMNRRSWFCKLMFALASLPLARLAVPRQALAEGQRVADLNETLRFGLRCRRPLEFEFVDLVVSKVDSKELPRALVLSMFDYARKKRPGQPFPYFQAGMKKRAEAIGVELGD